MSWRPCLKEVLNKYRDVEKTQFRVDLRVATVVQLDVTLVFGLPKHVARHLTPHA